jgi:hypothetical protein
MNADDRSPCPFPETQLSAYLDGDLAAADAAAVAAHLAQCRRCAGVAEDLAALRSALARLPRHEPHGGLADRIRRQAAADRLLRPPARRAVLGPVWAAAATLLLAAGLTWLAVPPAAVPAPAAAPGAVTVGQALNNARQDYQYSLTFLEAQASGLLPLAPDELRQPFQSEMAVLDELIEDQERTIAQGLATPQNWEALMDIYQQKVALLALFLSADVG